MITIEIIDLKNYKYNYDLLKKISSNDIIPVIKTNAYQIGASEVIKTLDNVKLFAVNDIYEAIALKKELENKEVLILSKLQVNDYHLLQKMDNIILTITSLDDIINLSTYGNLTKIKVHIYIDTGMNRFGFSNLKDFLKALEMLDSTKFKLTGIYSHITSKNNFLKQLEKFKTFTKFTPDLYKHLCATSTYLEKENSYPSRVGLDLICDGTKPYLKEVLKVVASVLEVRKIKRGESVGYNEEYIANKDTFIAILNVGYSNGFDRRLTGYEVYANNKYYKIIGNICMNHMFIEVDISFKSVKEVEIISKNNSLIKMANYLNTIPGEIITRLNLNKIYKR